MSRKFIESHLSSSSYSAKVAAIFLFNLLMGVGVLALPAAIAKAGIIAGILCLTTVSFMAFISITFLIEVLATANAWRGTKPVTRKGHMKGCDTEIVALGETSQIKVKTDVLSPPLFDIEEKFEMGYMSEMFLGAAGSTFFYAVLCLYLYGDLAIYAVSVTTTLEKATSASHQISYYSFLWGFVMLIGPFCFFNFQKTTYLQMFTMVMRNSAMVLMIVLTVLDIANGQSVPIDQLILWDAEKAKELIGMTVFTFMCHHSIPSVIIPLADKRKTLKVVLVDYIIVLLYCGTMVFTAVINKPVSQISQLYSLNFGDSSVGILANFLILYPVFTLSSNFPLICITLRNNLMELFPLSKGLIFSQQIFTVVALMPPVVIAVFIHDVGQLVSLTGSFAGLAIMFVTPALLVLYSREKLDKTVPHWRQMHHHMSPFQHQAWAYLTLVFSAFVLMTSIF
ncbi:transmembrane protein 104 homolog [Montipora foliosa]|uniref:transmembrane protein 104 homolog n=1 Tax=Montipora foliosa TaxID=591990 RepID=UPI0035F1820A